MIRMDPVSRVPALMRSRLSLSALNKATLSSRYVPVIPFKQRRAHKSDTYLVAYDTARTARKNAEECFADARGLGQRDRQTGDFRPLMKLTYVGLLVVYNFVGLYSVHKHRCRRRLVFS